MDIAGIGKPQLNVKLSEILPQTSLLLRTAISFSPSLRVVGGIVPEVLVLYQNCWYCTRSVGIVPEVVGIAPEVLVLYQKCWYCTRSVGIVPEV